MAYCTAEEIESRLDITGSSYSFDLTELANVASDWIDMHCHVPSSGYQVTADTTRYFDHCAINGRELVLDIPLLTVTSVTDGDGTTVSSANYRLTPRNGPRYNAITLLSSYYWRISDVDDEITVVGKFGYSLTTPTPVKEAALMLAGWIFKRYQAALQDNIVNQDLGQIVYGAAMPKQVCALLAPFVNYASLI